MFRNNSNTKSVTSQPFVLLVLFASFAFAGGCAIDSSTTEDDKQNEPISESVSNIVQGDVGNPSREEGSGSNTPGSAERDPTPIAAQSRAYAPQPQPWVQPLTGTGDQPQPQPWTPAPATTSPKH